MIRNPLGTQNQQHLRKSLWSIRHLRPGSMTRLGWALVVTVTKTPKTISAPHRLGNLPAFSFTVCRCRRVDWFRIPKRLDTHCTTPSRRAVAEAGNGRGFSHSANCVRPRCSQPNSHDRQFWTDHKINRLATCCEQKRFVCATNTKRTDHPSSLRKSQQPRLPSQLPRWTLPSAPSLPCATRKTQGTSRP